MADGEGTGGDAGVVAATPLVFGNLAAAAGDRARRWEPFREGIEICRLYHTPGGASGAFLRYAPGARLARHEHRGYEHIFVLAGSQTDDNGEHRAGAMLIHPPGTSHAVASANGCVVLALWERPVVFVDQPEAGETADEPVASGRV